MQSSIDKDNRVVADDEIDILELIKILYKRKLTIIFICFLAGVLSVVYALLQPPKYEVATKIIYQSAEQSRGGGMMALASMAGINVGGETDQSAYLKDILLSTEFLTYIIEKKWPTINEETQDTLFAHLHEIWEMEPDTLRNNWEYRFYLSQLGRLREGNYINYSMDNQSRVISLKTLFEDPFLSYEINKYIFERLNDKILNQMKYKARENREFIEERLSEVSVDLERSENRLKNFRERNLIISSPQLMLEENRLLRDVQMNQEMFIQLKKQYELARIEEIKDIPVLEVIDQPIIPVDKSEPKRKIIVMVGGSAGVFFGIISAFLFEWIAINRKRFGEVVKKDKTKESGA